MNIAKRSLCIMAILTACSIGVAACSNVETKNEKSANTKSVSVSQNSQKISGYTKQSTNGVIITIGKEKLYGQLDDSALAQEIKNMLPLNISMHNYNNRELYGHLSARPNEQPEGSFHFVNGDITYCAQNNSLALFYNKDNETLTMKVVRIGRITSDLKFFQGLNGASGSVKFELAK